MKLRMSLCAVILMLSLTCVVGGLASERQLGATVDDLVAATVHGGCHSISYSTCTNAGGCSATSVILFTGPGIYKHDTSVNCGSGSSCVTFTKTVKKCGT